MAKVTHEGIRELFLGQTSSDDSTENTGREFFSSAPGAGTENYTEHLPTHTKQNDEQTALLEDVVSRLDRIARESAESTRQIKAMRSDEAKFQRSLTQQARQARVEQRPPGRSAAAPIAERLLSDFMAQRLRPGTSPGSMQRATARALQATLAINPGAAGSPLIYGARQSFGNTGHTSVRPEALRGNVNQQQARSIAEMVHRSFLTEARRTRPSVAPIHAPPVAMPPMPKFGFSGSSFRVGSNFAQGWGGQVIPTPALASAPTPAPAKEESWYDWGKKQLTKAAITTAAKTVARTAIVPVAGAAAVGGAAWFGGKYLDPKIARLPAPQKGGRTLGDDLGLPGVDEVVPDKEMVDFKGSANQPQGRRKLSSRMAETAAMRSRFAELNKIPLGETPDQKIKREKALEEQGKAIANATAKRQDYLKSPLNTSISEDLHNIKNSIADATNATLKGSETGNIASYFGANPNMEAPAPSSTTPGAASHFAMGGPHGGASRTNTAAQSIDPLSNANIPFKTPVEGSSTPSSAGAGRKAAEAYLGRPIKDAEYDELIRATHAEAGSKNNPREQALIMGSILNRARNDAGGIIGVLHAPHQFQAVTGAGGSGPSANFTQGPGQSRKDSIEAAAENLLPGVSHNQKNFTAADPRAYGPGTNPAYLEKLKREGGSIVGGTVFNTDLAVSDKPVDYAKQSEAALTNPNIKQDWAFNTKADQSVPTAGGTPVSNTPSVVERQGQVAGIRRMPIKPELREQLQFAAEKTGLQVEVGSGGQEASGPNRTGSHRHDMGGAADLKLYETDPQSGQRRLLDMQNPADQQRMAEFTRQSVRAGATGVGAGMGYMGPSTLHIGGGQVDRTGQFNNTPASWGGAPWIADALRSGRDDFKAGQEELAEWRKQREMAAHKQDSISVVDNKQSSIFAGATAPRDPAQRGFLPKKAAQEEHPLVASSAGEPQVQPIRSDGSLGMPRPAIFYSEKQRAAGGGEPVLDTQLQMAAQQTLSNIKTQKAGEAFTEAFKAAAPKTYDTLLKASVHSPGTLGMGYGVGNDTSSLSPFGDAATRADKNASDAVHRLQAAVQGATREASTAGLGYGKGALSGPESPFGDSSTATAKHKNLYAQAADAVRSGEISTPEQLQTFLQAGGSNGRGGAMGSAQLNMARDVLRHRGAASGNVKSGEMYQQFLNSNAPNRHEAAVSGLGYGNATSTNSASPFGDGATAEHNAEKHMRGVAGLGYGTPSDTDRLSPFSDGATGKANFTDPNANAPVGRGGSATPMTINKDDWNPGHSNAVHTDDDASMKVSAAGGGQRDEAGKVDTTPPPVAEERARNEEKQEAHSFQDSTNSTTHHARITEKNTMDELTLMHTNGLETVFFALAILGPVINWMSNHISTVFSMSF